MGPALFLLWTGATRHNASALHTLYEAGNYSVREGRIDKIVSRSNFRTYNASDFEFEVDGRTHNVPPGFLTMTPGRLCKIGQCNLEVGNYVRVTTGRGRVIKLERCDEFVASPSGSQIKIGIVSCRYFQAFPSRILLRSILSFPHEQTD